MCSKIVLLCFVLVNCAAVFGQRAQTLLYNPRNPPKAQTLPYNPNRDRGRFIRVRRDLISGTASTNPSGGIDTQLSAGTGIGTPDHNLVGSVFAAGNTLGRTPTATGAALNYNINGHGVGITKEHIPGVRDSLTQQATVNLVNDGFHKLDANAFRSDIQQANGFQFQKTGGSLAYSNSNGHGASAGVSSIPNYGKTYELMGRANLWQSPDRNTRFDLTGTASKTMGGPFDGQKNFGLGLGGTHYFG